MSTIHITLANGHEYDISDPKDSMSDADAYKFAAAQDGAKASDDSAVNGAGVGVGAMMTGAGKVLSKAAPAMEEFATRPGATEALAGKLGTAGEVASAVGGLAAAGSDLYNGHPIDAVEHAVMGAAPAGIATGYQMLKKFAPEAAASAKAIIPARLSSVIGKGAAVAEKSAPWLEAAGPALGAMSAEGDALSRLNSPESIASLAKSMNPVDRLNLVKFYQDRHQHDMVDAIQMATAGHDITLPSEHGVLDTGSSDPAVKTVLGGSPTPAAVGDAVAKFGTHPVKKILNAQGRGDLWDAWKLMTGK